MYVLLFDIDGTLVLSGGAGKAAMEAALGSEFGAAACSAGVPFSGRTDRAILRDLFAKHTIEESSANRQRFLAAYLKHLPGCLGSHQGRVLPGVAELLEHMGGRADVWLGLLTGNVHAGARIKLGHFGLFHHFRFGGYGDDHHDRDDVARAALREVQRQLPAAVAPENIWVIGDTPLDVRCARAIGVRVAAVATGWHPSEELAACRPDLLMPDLADPERLLKHLE
jgi:phosphoglycolate phosphatase